MTLAELTSPVIRATLEARRRTGDTAIGTAAHQGKLRVVRIVYDTKGKSTVTPMSDRMSITETVAFLDAL
jgi:hypothetical protein